MAACHFVPLLIVLCEAGCATAPHESLQLGDLSSHGRRVLLKPANVQLCEMRLGSDCEPQPAWNASAQLLLQRALTADLSARGVEVVTDPNAGADYVLTVVLEDHFASSGLVAGRTAFLVVMLPVVIMFGAEGLGGGSSTGPFGPSASAGLEDATSHELVWQVLYTRGIADVRSVDGATETSQLLLNEFPWSQLIGCTSQDRASDDAGVSACTQSPLLAVSGRASQCPVRTYPARFPISDVRSRPTEEDRDTTKQTLKVAHDQRNRPAQPAVNRAVMGGLRRGSRRMTGYLRLKSNSHGIAANSPSRAK